MNKFQKITEGLVSRMVDMILLSIYYGLEFGLSGNGYRALDTAQSDIGEINYKSIKRSLRYLKDKGMINIIKDSWVLPDITSQGRKRLREIIPHYDNKRTWDKKLYVITYDIPKDEDIKRNLFRDFIKKIGCGMLQKSVWITPYNPKYLIREYVEKHNLEKNYIIISVMGKDGSIGDLDLKELVEKVYGLNILNEEYIDFISSVRENVSSRDYLIIKYLSILSNDPQLPFELLPEYWKGDEAHKRFSDLLKKNRIPD